jgi:catechol 2,3-dioxygenase-like lactoylglutathione lyase family enzyme
MTITGPVIDSGDAIGLARFYERLLGWTIVEQEGPRPGYPPADGWAKLRAPDGSMKIEFQWDEHYVPPTWPTEGGEQLMMMHLDIEVDDLDEGVAWAVAAGATVAAHQPQADVRVMLDPAGHPLCLFSVPG